MSRYIDADALMDALNVFKDRKNGNEHFMYGIETAKELLEIQPTVDAVPVVRCKDCVWRHDDSSPMWLPCMEKEYDDDWFCADGERKDNE